jgi:hypothetical protein
MVEYFIFIFTTFVASFLYNSAEDALNDKSTVSALKIASSKKIAQFFYRVARDNWSSLLG